MFILYAKLALRSLKRSWRDYGVHFITLALLFSLMSLSNLISAAGSLQAGFETAALPLLITLLSLLLLHDCNRFLLTRRAKELALYLLLGMDRGRLSLLFFLEELLLGLLSLAAGLLAGLLLFRSAQCLGLAENLRLTAWQLFRAGVETAACFALMEGLSLVLLRQSFQRMELRGLLEAKRENQPPDSRGRLWYACTAASFLILLALLVGFVLLPEETGMLLLSVIALPLIGFVFSFYRSLFALGGRLRTRGGGWLYRGDRLYQAGFLLSQGGREALVNSVLCLCLVFSSLSFAAGGVMLRVPVLDPFHQRWMAFLQLCVCVIFLVLYFAVLSLRQMRDLQRERSGLGLLWHLGRSPDELRCLLVRQLHQKFSLPLLLWGALYGMALVLAGGRLDALLQAPRLTLQLSMGFLGCLAVLYGLYFGLIYRASAVYLEHILPSAGNDISS